MSVSKKSRLVACLLSLFLGMLGVHNFYAGKTAKGICQLVLTLTVVGSLVSAVWSFVEFLIIAVGKFKDSEGNVISDWAL